LLDFGAIGKGYACDLIYAYLSGTEAEGAIVSVGGSIVAFGDYNKKGDKWRIAITHPRDADKYLGVISLDEGFVSTSGDYERYFEENGKRYHHILDATTGYPSESGLISVIVVAKSGIMSDALSTACLLVGEKKAIEILEGAGASAILVDENLNITTVGEIDFEKQ
jgi:thiamine biosynthesis lipoprotein